MAKQKITLEYVWKDRKRTFLGLPWSFTRYRLTAEKLIIVTGFFTLKEEEVRLYRIMDLSKKRTFGQRLFGLGTITVKSSDKTLPQFELKNIKNSDYVKERLSELIEAERVAKRITGRELMPGGEGFHGDDDDFDHDDLDHDEFESN